jgi:hypothetical protein
MTIGAGHAATEERRYLELIDRLRTRVADLVPPGARVLVISHGDERMLRIDGREAGHFPQSQTGQYAGHHPADGAEARTHLRALRDAGAKYLVIPETSRWWLDYYGELRDTLVEGELVHDEPETCLIFCLDQHSTAAAGPLEPAALAAARTAPQVAGLIDALLPERAGVVLVGPGAGEVELHGRRAWRIENTPERRWASPEAMKELSAARGSGARYVVVLKPADPRHWPDSRLTGRLTESQRPVFEQRLAAGFELIEIGFVGGRS